MTIIVRPPKGIGAPVPVETTLVKKVNADGVLTFDILENKYKNKTTTILPFCFLLTLGLFQY
ncbi:tail tube TT1 domain-containing protein, partial [Staphylococcus aureus]|uniref:tail tube TT1 domain-containing protein n=1 Tax=Staphylococcus aureus TaxID=1280 RepID=UPI000851F227